MGLKTVELKVSLGVVNRLYRASVGGGLYEATGKSMRGALANLNVTMMVDNLAFRPLSTLQDTSMIFTADLLLPWGD